MDGYITINYWNACLQLSLQTGQKHCLLNLWLSPQAGCIVSLKQLTRYTCSSDSNEELHITPAYFWEDFWHRLKERQSSFSWQAVIPHVSSVDMCGCLCVSVEAVTWGWRVQSGAKPSFCFWHTSLSLNHPHVVLNTNQSNNNSPLFTASSNHCCVIFGLQDETQWNCQPYRHINTDPWSCEIWVLDKKQLCLESTTFHAIKYLCGFSTVWMEFSLQVWDMM